MKVLIYLLYSAALIMIAVALFGGTLSEPLIEEFSISTIQTVGIDKSRIDSLDSQIDLSFYNMNLFLYRLERLKNIVTFGDDEQKPIEFKRYNYISEIVYKPILIAVSYLIRGIMLSVGIILMLITAIMHIFVSYINLRKRVKILEERILNFNPGIYGK